MIRTGFPTRFEDASVKIRDRYTVADIARIGLSMMAGWYFADDIGFSMAGFQSGTVGILAGLAVGVLLAEYTPNGEHLDEHLVGYLDLLMGGRSVRCPPIKRVSDGVAVFGDDTVIGLIKMSSLELEALPDSDQITNLETVHDLFQARYSFEIHSRQRIIDLSQYQGAKDSGVVTDHYIVVRGESPHQVDNQCSDVLDALSGGDFYVERLTGQDLKQGLKRLYFEEATVSPPEYKISQEEKPVRRLLYVSEYPEEVKAAWIADVLTVDAPGLIDVVQVSRPISQVKRDQITRQISRIKVEKSASKSPTRKLKLERMEEDAEALVRLEQGGEVLSNYGVYVVARGATSREAEETLEAVESKLGRLRITTEKPSSRIHHGVKAASAFHGDLLGKTQVVPGKAAASGFAFAAYDAIEEGGFTAGRDTQNGLSVILERFSWEAGHIVVTGKTGSGKSYWTGLMLLRSVQKYQDIDIYVLDPKKSDYGNVVEALDGETFVLDDVDLSKIETGDIVRYTVADPARDNTEMLTEAVRHIYRRAAETESKTLVVIDETHRIITRGNQVHEGGLQAVSTLIRESRDRNVAATLVSQNANEFTRSDGGQNILRNTDCYLFFRQQDIETEVPDFFKFSETDTVDLSKLQTGTKRPFSEAIIQGPVNTKLKIESTEEEHQILENGVADGGTVQEPGTDQPETHPRSMDRELQEEQSDPESGSDQPEPGPAGSTSREGLMTVWSRVSGASVGLFELGLFAVLPLAELLIWSHPGNSIAVTQAFIRDAAAQLPGLDGQLVLNGVQALAPVVVLPQELTLLTFLPVWAGAVIALESFWTTLLAVDRWIAGDP